MSTPLKSREAVEAASAILIFAVLDAIVLAMMLSGETDSARALRPSGRGVDGVCRV